MSVFADYYDSFVGADYSRIADYIKEAINKYKNDSVLLCDLGCGTGSIALDLAEAGYDMIGIDSDETMLMRARDKAFERNINSLLYLNQNICEFELYGTVDVIYSTLDTLNYICDPNDLEKLFYWVRNYLNYDGLFIFDINTEHKFSYVLDGYLCTYDNGDAVCIWESAYNKNESTCVHDLIFFVEQSDGRFKRFDEQQCQRYYSTEFIKELCDKYDFEILEIKDDYTDKDPYDDTERLSYVLKTKK